MSIMRSTDQAMRTGREAMDRAYSTCNGVYTNVDRVRDTLVGNWQGGAATKYDSALIHWLEELRLITNDMNEMVTILGGTERNFHEMENENMMSADWAKQLNPNQPDISR